MLKDNIITPDKFLSLSNNCMSRYTVDIKLTPERNIFFIKPDFLKEFITAVLPLINYNFILITHDSDIPVTEEYNIILNNPFLVKWFGMNCHIIHNKLQPIPIGMANECWPHGDKDVILKVVNENNEKKNFVYCNFDINTNLKDRSYALSNLRKLTFIDFETQKLSFEDYIRKLSSYKYVISPPGNSVDCHRVWESMYVKTIPIVLKSIPMVNFKDSPILFIDDWSCLNEELLYNNYENILKRSNQKSDFLSYKDIITNLI
jgi:hypothetical protein